MRIAFQGEHGAYSEAAIFERFGDDSESVPYESFDEVFAAVTAGACELGFVPIENSLAGSIHRNYDLLLQHELEVIGEHYLHVRHCLIGCPGSTLAGIRRVISHPQALAQCEGYLRRLNGVKAEQVYDTAGSVRIMRDLQDPTVAAIASRRAAELYGMPLLAENIQDHPANFTRFLLITPPVGAQGAAEQRVSLLREPGPDAKTSIVFALNNQPGALFKAMSVFALRDIDLVKIESRPLVGKLWEYFFYIDLAGSHQEERVRNALANLAEYATFLRVLGSYPRHRVA